VGGELLESSSSPSYAEIFYEHFPFYLSIGMTYDQYWNDDCLLVKYYRKAYDLRRQQRNQELWMQGLYIYEALCDVAPILHAFAKPGTKPIPYTEKPYPLTKEEATANKEAEEKAARDKAKAMFMAWAARLKLPEHKVVNADGH
jgi:hypothetical protein